MESKKEYFKVLDVLRVWAIVEIVLHHARLGDFFHLRAYIFADFFFILSGFILFKNDFIKETFSFDGFVIKRLMRLYPLHLAATIALCIHFLLLSQGIPVFKDGSLYTFFNYVFFLQGLGFRKISDGDWNYPSWAISVEFWSNVIFALFLRYKNKITYLLLAMLGYLVIYSIEGHLNTFTYNYFGFLNSGMVRGLSGMCLGAFLATLNFHKEKEASVYIWTLAEVLSVAGIVLLLKSSQDETSLYFDFLAMPVFALMILYFSQAQGLVSKLVLKLRINKLSIYVFAAYLFHIPALKIMYEGLRIGEKYQVPTYIGLVALLAVLSHHFVEKPFRRLDPNQGKLNSFWVFSIFVLLLMVVGLIVKLIA